MSPENSHTMTPDNTSGHRDRYTGQRYTGILESEHPDLTRLGQSAQYPKTIAALSNPSTNTPSQNRLVKRDSVTHAQ
ncbi:hypothetical protein N9Z64_02440 [bacterium]|nr:hypothetical protein [bacterium]